MLIDPNTKDLCGELRDMATLRRRPPTRTHHLADGFLLDAAAGEIERLEGIVKMSVEALRKSVHAEDSS